MFNRKLKEKNLELLRKIDGLINENDDLKYEIKMLEGELKALKPIVEDPMYDLPKSKECQDCMYAVRSNWNHAVIACRKNAICCDFKDKEDKE